LGFPGDRHPRLRDCGRPVSGLARLDAPPSRVSPVACWRAHTRLPLRGQHRRCDQIGRPGVAHLFPV